MTHVYNHNVYAFYNSAINITFNNIYDYKAKCSSCRRSSGQVSKITSSIGVWPEIIYLGVIVNYASKKDHAAVTTANIETI